MNGISRPNSLSVHRALPWQCSMTIKDTLIGEGWVSPNTYCNHYSPVTDGPAVYMLHITDKETFGHTIVAYVGMSLRLSRRLESHNIKPLLEAAGYWVSVWFKPVVIEDLRSVERAYIERFDPPWNIACCRRGVSLNG